MIRPTKSRLAPGVGPVLIALSLVLPLSLLSSSARGAGVHRGGVASCAYCHVMHDAQGGPGPGPGSNNPLLIDNNSSDLCLSCHASDFGAVMGGDPLAPPPETGAGNFVFLLENNLNDGPDGLVNPIAGDAAGHNINAPTYGLAPDPTHATSPGGTYPSNNMRCTSCHDPHGNGSFRMLRGTGNTPGPGGHNFVNPAPDGVGLDLLMGTSETNANHVAYRGGMSAWCANCHGDYLLNEHSVLSDFGHPSDESFDSDIVAQYDAYNGTLDPTGGSAAVAYLAAVPFEDAGSTTGSTFGPSPASRVICLSCHRAHASSAPHAGRWDFNVATLGEDGVLSGSYPIPNPYSDPGQQPLCYKCHADGSD